MKLSSSNPVNRAHAEHYTWPSVVGAERCDGWHLHRSADLSVMPPGTAEQRHLHRAATQFFYVLSGELVIELAGNNHRLDPGTGLSIPPGIEHQVINSGVQVARFLVISQPPSHGDRIAAPDKPPRAE